MNNEIESFVTAAKGLASLPAWAKWGGIVSGALAGYFLPSESLRGIALATFGLVVIDTVTGVMAAYNTGVAIKSAKFGRLISKLVVYTAFVMGCVLIAKALPMLGPSFVEAAATAPLAIVAIREGLSVVENLHLLGLEIPKFLKDALSGKDVEK